jgi:pimeloyl-ACP methyl ester carboxylesterase
MKIMSHIQYLDRKNKKLAYVHTKGRLPTVLFIHGFRSDMTGNKALALEEWCISQDRGYVRFDCQGHGKSSGAFEEGSISAWKQDVLDVIDHIVQGPTVLVGSSMGGWLAMLAARERKKQVLGMVGIASAPDFTEHLIWDALNKKQKQEILAHGKTTVKSDYDDAGYPITKKLIEDGRKHLLLGGLIDVDCPVHLIHGMKDADVPWEVSLSINEKLATKDVRTTLVEEGDHRMSSAKDIQLLVKCVDKILAKVSV